MLLRSSSSPILSSLLHSSENPIAFDKSRSPTDSDNMKKVPFMHSGPSNFNSFSCHSPPISSSFNGFSENNRESNVGSNGMRRTQSDGNLENLDVSRVSRRPNSCLESIPSFSVYNRRNYQEEEEEGDEADALKTTVTIGDNIEEGFSFTRDNNFHFFANDEHTQRKTHLYAVQEENMSMVDKIKQFPPLFLARGLGIDVHESAPPLTAVGDGGGGGRDFSLPHTYENGDQSDLEKYYKMMVEQNPCNSLFLRNYAEFLYEWKRDLHGAEEYYSRAILVEPGDGEILARYAKLIWELHRDHERALSYFEQAVQSAPADSHVHAAYASFLWETEEEEDITEERNSTDVSAIERPVTSATA